MGEHRRWALVAADGHGAFAGRERTHALVIGELVVSDVEPIAFMQALHPDQGEDGFHHRVAHIEASTALTLLALPLVPGALDAVVRAGQVPSVALQKSIEQHINQETCTLLDQPNGRGVFEPHTLEASRGRGTRGSGAREVHRDHRELHRRVLFRLHDLALLVHNHLSLGPGHYKALPLHIYTTSRCIKSTHASIKRRVMTCMHACVVINASVNANN